MTATTQSAATPTALDVLAHRAKAITTSMTRKDLASMYAVQRLGHIISEAVMGVHEEQGNCAKHNNAVATMNLLIKLLNDDKEILPSAPRELVMYVELLGERYHHDIKTMITRALVELS